MRGPVFSLRTGILAQLTFLIAAAMLLINVVWIKFSERDLIREKIHSAKLLALGLEQTIGSALAERKAASPPNLDVEFDRFFRRLLSEGGFSALAVTDRNGNPAYSLHLTAETKSRGLTLARRALETKTWTTNFYGATWGVVWLGDKEAAISGPLRYEDRWVGGIYVGASLAGIYRNIRRTEKFILLYIFLDTIILAMVGLFLLSRIVVNPIQRLVKMTSDYKEGETIPAIDSQPNEIGKLSLSLNRMLKRLDESKSALKTHIDSLEKANRERKKAEKELIRSEKLASVGRLAAGVAHEIGNPIGVLLGYLELIKKGDVTEEEKKDFLERMESEITRISAIIRNLLDFSRPASGQCALIGIHDLISSTMDMLMPHPMMEGIELRLNFEATFDRVLADPSELQQVFVNIVMNAADALGERDSHEKTAGGKTLTIETRNLSESIELRFEDSGPGISSERIDRIFDPFFTTKAPGKGTGLGLSVCYRIVESLGGAVLAESPPGQGATIRVILPLHMEAEGRGAAETRIVQ